MIDAATSKPPAFDVIVLHSFSRFHSGRDRPADLPLGARGQRQLRADGGQVDHQASQRRRHPHAGRRTLGVGLGARVASWARKAYCCVRWSPPRAQKRRVLAFPVLYRNGAAGAISNGEDDDAPWQASPGRRRARGGMVGAGDDDARGRGTVGRAFYQRPHRHHAGRHRPRRHQRYLGAPGGASSRPLCSGQSELRRAEQSRRRRPRHRQPSLRQCGEGRHRARQARARGAATRHPGPSQRPVRSRRNSSGSAACRPMPTTPI